jgi:D-3-phosphoglycerate dehydrogenase
LGRDSEGVIAGVEPYDDYVLDRLPILRCISRCGIGIDNICHDQCGL